MRATNAGPHVHDSRLADAPMSMNARVRITFDVSCNVILHHLICRLSSLFIMSRLGIFGVCREDLEMYTLGFEG